jgi:GNAT superfamily N-acetyltransferase
MATQATSGERVRIREASVADAATLASMRFEFRSALTDPTESRAAFRRRCLPWMRSRLRRGTWRCWVAERRDGLVGHLWLAPIEKIPNPVDEPERHAYITNVFVSPDARGLGIGERLVAWAMAWCRINAVDTVFLWPTSRSRSLYVRHGFRGKGPLMAASLAPPISAARPPGRRKPRSSRRGTSR